MSSKSTPLPKLLIVDDDRHLLSALHRALRRDFILLKATNRVEALREVAQEPDIILLDIRLDPAIEQDRGGMELLRELLSLGISAPIVMFSAYGDVETAVTCMRNGATDFVQKSAGAEELKQRLLTALDHDRLSRQVTHLEERLQQLDPTEIVGTSTALEQVKHHIHMVALDGVVTVLVRGETGTGKELVARAIHRIGRRSREPFVPVSIAALNPNLVETEMFGHEPGAYTGARERRTGFIEKARRGVLFLDEIGDLPVETQLKLLRFLEEHRFTRVGSTDEMHVDVQIIAATNRCLEEAVAQGHLRADLYFRLRGAEIVLPPLRERVADIPLLTAHFLTLFRRQGRTRLASVTEAAMNTLMNYSWPGNVRELKTVVERTIIYSAYNGHDSIEKSDLPLDTLLSSAHGRSGSGRGFLGPEGIRLDLELARTEMGYIEEALRLTAERKEAAWKLLGLNDRFAMRRRIKALCVHYPELLDMFPTVRRLYGNLTNHQDVEYSSATTGIKPSGEGA